MVSSKKKHVRGGGSDGDGSKRSRGTDWVPLIIEVIVVFATIGLLSCSISGALNEGTKGKQFFKKMCEASGKPKQLIDRIYDLALAYILTPLAIAVLPYVSKIVMGISTPLGKYLSKVAEKARLWKTKYNIRSNLESAAEKVKAGDFEGATQDLSNAEMDAMEHGALPDGEKVSQQISDIVNSESFKKALAAQKTLIDEPGAAAVKAFEKAAEEAAEEAGSGIEDLAKELLEHS
jgi:hypothetical protein